MTPKYLSALDAGDWAYFHREFCRRWDASPREVEAWFEHEAFGLDDDARCEVVDRARDDADDWRQSLAEGLLAWQDEG